MTISWLIAPLLAAGLVAALAVPGVSRMATSLGVVDRPTARSVNRRPDVPLLGGLAVALGFYVGLALAMILIQDARPLWGRMDGVFTGSLLILMLGVFDDRWNLKASFKLLCQILAAAVAIAHGFRIEKVTDPFTLSVFFFPPWLSWILTTVWIVGITNALNLMDGLDGCTAGVGAIIGVALSYVAWQMGLPAGLVLGIAFVGALLGFLPFNFPPARIFLGDTGALFIGYCLALLSLEGFRKATVLTFVVPLLALAVPLLDTGLSIVRRVRRRRHIFSPDKEHMHHRLLDSAGSQQSAVLSIYFLTACFCIIAISFTRLQGYSAIFFLAAVAALTFRLLRNLGFFDLDSPEPVSTGGPARQGGQT